MSFKLYKLNQLIFQLFSWIINILQYMYNIHSMIVSVLEIEQESSSVQTACDIFLMNYCFEIFYW